jgi:hypothetical protein
MKTNQTKPKRTSTSSVQCWMLNAVLLATATGALADVRYMDVNSTNATPPYSDWSTAATDTPSDVNVLLNWSSTNPGYDSYSVTAIAAKQARSRFPNQQIIY